MGLAFSACLLGTRAANTLGNHGDTAAELRARFRPVQVRPAPSLGVTSAHPPESPRMRLMSRAWEGPGVRTTHGFRFLGIMPGPEGKTLQKRVRDGTGPEKGTGTSGAGWGLTLPTLLE